MKRARFLAICCSALTIVAIAGCGSSSSSKSNSSAAAKPPASGSTQSSGGAAPSGGAIHVTMKNLAFNPATIHAKVGDTVEWTNLDGPPHNVTWTAGPRFTSSSTLATNATFSLKLTQAGTIHYICTIHPFMKATIVVSK
jgi:amicyanin